MNWQIVRLDDVAATPWRNGGGVTRELLAWPGAQDWRVRMSVAQVTRDGPFSRFDGVQRWFAVLAGAGVRLRLDGAAHVLTQRSAPFVFDGAADTDCRLLAGPTQDFNLMLRQCTGRMQRLQGRHAFGCGAGALVAVYGAGNAALLDVGGGQTQIAPQTLAWRILDAGGPVQVEAADALWMEIAP
ncbi:HutD family protein [Caenimonas terrae]|uniref:HutD family protein n=1 Tax=Caenimonas terrae TaxID=696074 RepID=A0ABW0NKL4_9BURK